MIPRAKCTLEQLFPLAEFASRHNCPLEGQFTYFGTHDLFIGTPIDVASPEDTSLH